MLNFSSSNSHITEAPPSAHVHLELWRLKPPLDILCATPHCHSLPSSIEHSIADSFTLTRLQQPPNLQALQVMPVLLQSQRLHAHNPTIVSTPPPSTNLVESPTISPPHLITTSCDNTSPPHHVQPQQLQTFHPAQSKTYIKFVRHLTLLQSEPLPPHTNTAGALSTIAATATTETEQRSDCK